MSEPVFGPRCAMPAQKASLASSGERPQQDSNLRTRLRRESLQIPLTTGGNDLRIQLGRYGARLGSGGSATSIAFGDLRRRKHPRDSSGQRGAGHRRRASGGCAFQEGAAAGRVLPSPRFAGSWARGPGHVVGRAYLEMAVPGHAWCHRTDEHGGDVSSRARGLSTPGHRGLACPNWLRVANLGLARLYLSISRRQHEHGAECRYWRLPWSRPTSDPKLPGGHRPGGQR